MSGASPPQDFAVSNLHIQNNFSAPHGVFNRASAASVETDLLTTDSAVVNSLVLPPPPASGYILQAADATGLVGWVSPNINLTLYSITTSPVAVPTDTTVNMVTFCNDIATAGSTTPLQYGNGITIVGTTIHLNNKSIGETYSIIIMAASTTVSTLVVTFTGDVTASDSVGIRQAACATMSNTLTTTAPNATFTISVNFSNYGGGTAQVRQGLITLVKN
jgi:hypothetical protein